MPETEQERRYHGRIFVRLYRAAIAQGDHVRYLTRLHSELERLGVHERLIEAAYVLGRSDRKLMRRINAPSAIAGPLN